MNSTFLSISSFGPFTSTFRDTSLSQSSIYSSLFYQGLNEKLNIEFGGRLNVHSRYGNNHTYTFNPSYSLTKNFRVFGSIATAFKAPSLFQLYSSSGREELKPERSKTYEIGLQQNHDKVATRLVYFHRDIKATGLSKILPFLQIILISIRKKEHKAV
jgi:vitamin B12 transporter